MKLYKRILRHPHVESFLIVFGVFVLRAFKLTIPFERVGFEEANKRTAEGKSNIYVFWHGRMLMMPFAYKGAEIYVLISLHSDGSLVSGVMKHFNIYSVRGSTFKRAVGALREIERLVGQGKDVVFTPDGPRGPRELVQMGAVMAAKLGGVPVFPVSFSTSRRKFLGSWDRFLVPFPFSRGIFICGKPVVVPRNADRAFMEKQRIKLEKSLIELGNCADNYFISGV